MNRQLPSSTTCSADRPVRATAEIIEHKWATLLVRDLLSGKKRFSEWGRSLVSISPNVLNERLRELEPKQLVSRTVFPTLPPTTEYELIAIGKEFETVIRAMQDFGTLLLKNAGPLK